MKNNECCEVVIVGAAHTDLQLYPVGADVLDTASYSVKQMVLTVGGDALNEATVITRLGHKVRLVSWEMMSLAPWCWSIAERTTSEQNTSRWTAARSLPSM